MRFPDRGRSAIRDAARILERLDNVAAATCFSHRSRFRSAVYHNERRIDSGWHRKEHSRRANAGSLSSGGPFLVKIRNGPPP